MGRLNCCCCCCCLWWLLLLVVVVVTSLLLLLLLLLCAIENQTDVYSVHQSHMRPSVRSFQVVLCRVLFANPLPPRKVIALFAEGPTAIRNVYNWRVKETERMK